MPHKSVLIALLCSALAVTASAQNSDSMEDQQNPTTQTNGAQEPSVTPMPATPTYRVNVVSRTTKAVDYRHRAGSTKVEMQGTELQPAITGEAKVDSKAGRMEINTSLEHMKPASTYGPQYLTYVLWAITPAGRPMNLGEVLPNHDGKVNLHSTTNLQSFGLIVTAEPYFAVTRPSDMMVAQNIIRYSTKGWEQPIDAKYEALDKNEYTVDLSPSQLPATSENSKNIPLELLEAQNAVAIAKAAGAQQYAPDTLQKAEDFLAKGEDYLHRKQSTSAIGTVTRYAAQQAEDARVLAIQKKTQEQAAAERQKLQDQARENEARAEQEANQRQQAEQTAEQQRLAAEQAQAQAQQAAQEAAQERALAEQARQQALAQQQAAMAQQQQLQQQLQSAQTQAQQAEMEREQTRARLTQQLNQVLQTRDTARGLIVNMSDVLFDFNRASLKPGARERLAKVAGIILAYPDLKLQVEGFTDNIGSEAYNQQLSEKRADTVRNFLEQQGVNSNNISARGFGESDPVASNTTAAGRQQNRRVELVVSGQSIATNRRVPGSPATTPGTSAEGTVGNSSTVNRSSSYESSTTTTQPASTGNPQNPQGQASQPVNSQPNNQTAPPAGTMNPPSSVPASQVPSQTLPAGTPMNTPSGTTTTPPPNTPPPVNPQ